VAYGRLKSAKEPAGFLVTALILLERRELIGTSILFFLFGLRGCWLDGLKPLARQELQVRHEETVTVFALCCTFDYWRLNDDGSAASIRRADNSKDKDEIQGSLHSGAR
jgi:hypothetical protein